jgi:mannose-1-phosphate guanylyltransferase/mannose-6-phosphate isomerase
MGSSKGKISPVVLSGGAGTRLWPMSREIRPKQLLPLSSPQSLLQNVLGRVADTSRFSPPLIICNQEHRFVVAEQCRESHVSSVTIVLEPEGRNTAPAVAVAALVLAAEDPEAILLVLPSDHIIGDKEAFLRAVEIASLAAREGKLVTFGITPDAPETGYGYIRGGESIDNVPGCYLVERFVEKPDLKTAQGYISEGQWHWNSGMFLLGSQVYLDELARLHPEILEACRACVAKAEKDLDFLRLDATSFCASPSQSIDYAVMEHTAHAVVMPVTLGWSDVGSWSELWKTSDKDEQGNVAQGKVVITDVNNSYIRSEHLLVAVIGLDDVVVVATDDAVLVSHKDSAQEVKTLVANLKAQGHAEATVHSKVYRPWGAYQCIDAGDSFQAKRLTINPGGILSLQKHQHRAEHWVVVSGTAHITRGEETIELRENESTFIPQGMVHRLENKGDQTLLLIEVQSGDYLGEDDIERLEDIYGRN